MKKLGYILSSMILLMVIISFISVAIHFLFNIVSIQLQELIIYLHATVFMLGIVYAFHHDKHVRIDIIYQKLQATTQKKINLLGTVFLLLPFFIFMFYASFNYVLSSWNKLEGSAESGGLPLVFAFKTLLLVLPLLMIFVSIHKMFTKK